MKLTQTGQRVVVDRVLDGIALQYGQVEQRLVLVHVVHPVAVDYAVLPFRLLPADPDRRRGHLQDAQVAGPARDCGSGKMY